MPAPREAPRKLQDETGTGTELLSLVTCPRASVSLGNVQGCISSPQGPARRGCSGSCSGCAAPCWICRISSTSWIGELVTGTVATHTPGRPKVGVGGHYPGNCVECYPSGTSQERGVHFLGLRKAGVPHPVIASWNVSASSGSFPMELRAVPACPQEGQGTPGPPPSHCTFHSHSHPGMDALPAASSRPIPAALRPG